MYRYQSNLVAFRNIASGIFEVLVPLTLSLLFSVTRAFDVPTYGILLTVSTAISVLIAFRRVVTPHLCLAFFLLAVLTHSTLALFSLHVSWGFVVDSLLVLTTLLSYTYYMYVDGVEAIFVGYIPLTLIISTAVGTYLGVVNILRYLLLTLIDSIISAVMFSSRRCVRLNYTSSLLYFITLYSSPLVNPDLSVLTIFAMLHLIRNAFTFNSIRNLRARRVVGYLLGLDILLKPLVIVVWI